MAEITVAPGDGGDVVFAVSWTEPMRVEFKSRLEAERFAGWLRAVGLTIEIDGSCGPCSAHHASGHGCPACGADLGLRIAPPAGSLRYRPMPIPVAPDRFLIPREQHRIRLDLAAETRRSRLAEARRRQLAESDVAHG